MDIQVTQIAIQLAIFLGIMIMMRQLVFKPLLRIVELRQHQTLDREREAKEILARSQSIIQKYDQSMSETRAEAQRKMQAAMQEATVQAKEIVGKARENGQDLFATKKNAMQQERLRLQGEMNQKVEHLADDFFKVVLQ